MRLKKNKTASEQTLQPPSFVCVGVLLSPLPLIFFSRRVLGTSLVRFLDYFFLLMPGWPARKLFIWMLPSSSARMILVPPREQEKRNNEGKK